jgi:hypothetical protein
MSVIKVKSNLRLPANVSAREISKCQRSYLLYL